MNQCGLALSPDEEEPAANQELIRRIQKYLKDTNQNPPGLGADRIGLKLKRTAAPNIRSYPVGKDESRIIKSKTRSDR